MTELGDRLRSIAVLADDYPNWTGVAFVACLDDVTTWVASDADYDSPQTLVEGLHTAVKKRWPPVEEL